MDTKLGLETIRNLEDHANMLMGEASDLAVDVVEAEARKILAADPDLHEYVMAMGSGFFTGKDGGKYDMNAYPEDVAEQMCEDNFPFRDSGAIMDDDLEQFEEFFKIVLDLNDRFNVCGCPMRFTANSEIVRDWGDTIKNPVKYIERKNHD